MNRVWHTSLNSVMNSFFFIKLIHKKLKWPNAVFLKISLDEIYGCRNMTVLLIPLILQLLDAMMEDHC